MTYCRHFHIGKPLSFSFQRKMFDMVILTNLLIIFVSKQSNNVLVGKKSGTTILISTLIVKICVVFPVLAIISGPFCHFESKNKKKFPAHYQYTYLYYILKQSFVHLKLVPTCTFTQQQQYKMREPQTFMKVPNLIL